MSFFKYSPQNILELYTDIFNVILNVELYHNSGVSATFALYIKTKVTQMTRIIIVELQ